MMNLTENIFPYLCGINVICVITVCLSTLFLWRCTQEARPITFRNYRKYFTEKQDTAVNDPFNVRVLLNVLFKPLFLCLISFE